MYKKISKKILLVLLMFLLVGCGSKNLKTVSEKNVTGNNGVEEVNEKISKSDSTIKYEYETTMASVTVDAKYNGKAFTYKNGRLSKDHYTVYLEVIVYEYPKFDEEKELDGYNKTTISGKEALLVRGDVGETILVKVDEYTILYITSVTDGKILASEVTEDNDYKNFMNSIKISIKKKEL